MTLRRLCGVGPGDVQLDEDHAFGARGTGRAQARPFSLRALYAGQLADEIGTYDDDPLGRLGSPKFQLLRANRCVVDIGIHHLRWGRVPLDRGPARLTGKARRVAP